jgi:hypothetical protein
MKNTIKCDQCEEESRFSKPVPEAWLPVSPAKWICNPCKEDNRKPGIGLTGGLFRREA